jgi:iron complex transport system substrate-binding protein
MSTRRAWLWLLAALLVGAPPVQAQHAVTDSAGRTVTLPQDIRRVFAAGPPAAIALYVLAPERLVGWPRALHANERPYIAAPYRDLPTLGRLTGRDNTANVEVVLQARPDLVFDYGAINPTYVSLAERVQQQTGIPYLLIDGAFANTAASLRLLGKILAAEERAERLARYAEDTFQALDRALAAIPLAQRPRVYFARGPNGLETGTQGSINTEIIDRVGAVNVAVAFGRQGLATVSPEQLLKWNPDTIITLEDSFYAAVWSDPLWQSIDAVKRKRVFLAPRLPFGWVDQPPSLNRLIGVKWLSRLFYPPQFKDDLRAVTRDFYRVFYQVELDEAQLDALLAKAGEAAR